MFANQRHRMPRQRGLSLLIALAVLALVVNPAPVAANGPVPPGPVAYVRTEVSDDPEIHSTVGQGLVACPQGSGADYCLPLIQRPYTKVDGAFASPGHRILYRVRVTASAPDRTKFGITCAADAAIPGVNPNPSTTYGYGSLYPPANSQWTAWTIVDIPATEVRTCGILNGWNGNGTTYEAQIRAVPATTGMRACDPASGATYCLPSAYRWPGTIDGGWASTRGQLSYRVRVSESSPTVSMFGIACADSGIPGMDTAGVRSYGYGSITSGANPGWTDWVSVQVPVTELGTCGVVNGWNGGGTTYEAQVRVDAIPAEQVLGAGNGHGNNPTHLQEDPVNTATGNYVSTVTDLALPGRGLGLAFTRTYNSLDTAVGPLGVGWRHNYGASLTINPGGSVTFVAEDGARLEFAPDGTGGFETPAGATSSLAAVSGGYELLRRDRVRYAFNATGQLSSVADRNANAITFGYAAGRLATITDTVGRTLTLTYDTQGRLTQLAGPLGSTVGYAYTAAGLLAAVTDRRGGVTRYTYDAASRLLTVVDANAHTVVRNEYGADGRIAAQTDARGNRGTFAWDPVTHTSTYTDARGGAWRDVYAGNALRRQIDALDNTTSYAYDAQFNLIAVTDPRGNTTAMTYDPSGNLLTRTAPAPLSHVETFTYNALGDVLTATDARSNTTTYAYDAAGNLLTVTEPGTAVTTLTRDSAGTGLLMGTTDPRGKTTSFGYDAQANVANTTDPLGNVTTMAYDALGRLTSVVEPRGNVTGAVPAEYRTSLTYAGELLASTSDPLGNVLTTTYDAVGNRLSITDPLNNVTSYTYGLANHLLSVTDADLNTTTYAYDVTGNLVTRTDAKNHVTTYAYDLAGRLTATIDPLGNDWLLTYDPAGNLLTRTDARDQLSTYAYDVLNRPTAINYGPAGTPDVGYAYDAVGNVTQLSDGAGSESYAYDTRNRLTSLTRGADTFSYAYDAASNLLSRTYPGGGVTTYAYDDAGRLASATVGAAATTYAYDAAGNLRTTATPDGLTATHTYDAAGRLLEVAHLTAAATLSRFTYGLDAAGRRTNLTTALGATGFSYDDRGQLLEACFGACPAQAAVPVLPCLACVGSPLPRPAPQTAPDAADSFVRYTYDAVGNRLTEATHLGTTTSAYDAADRLVSVTPPGASPATYTYDANGNQTAAGVDTFAWDAADRLSSATVAGTPHTYAYAGDGRRLSATAGGSTTQFVWDLAFGLPMLVAERDGTGATLRSYTYGRDLLSQSAAGATSYYHHDGLGSAVDLTDPNGASLAWAEFAPFGDPRSAATATGAPLNPFRFTGEYLDPTGLYHLRARQYDPGLGRFLSQDPVAPTLDDPYVASYVYVRNAPQDFADPSGRVRETPSPGSSPFPSAQRSPTTRPSPSHAPPLIPGPIPTPPPGWSPQPAPQVLPPQLPIRACDQAQWAVSWGVFGAGAVQAIRGLRGGRGPIDVFLGGVEAAGGLVGVVDSLTGCEL